jgi:hypothetical protein
VICTTANALWLGGCLREAGRFRRAARRVRAEQERVLQALLLANSDTEFGRSHRFSRIRSVREYQKLVPLRTYDDYRSYVDRICGGSVNVLTREPVRLLQPTSGSAAATKLIPYTASLQREFQRGIQAWIADLFLHHPALMHGQAYWSISPSLTQMPRTAAGTPIGFEDDAAYVGGWRSRLVRAVMAAPPSIRQARDMETFQYSTLLALVRRPNLRLMSVWNPTFLLLLVERLEPHADALLRDLQSDPSRLTTLQAALRAPTSAERHAMLWPRLGVISCWADANAAAPSRQLEALFPHARIQAKGLIATEGFISFPLASREGSALALRSHFLEFAPLDGDDEAKTLRPLTADELQRGQRYEIIVSNGGGLYRYRLGDLVEVVDHLHECPIIRFVGRQLYVSDWFGEKLNEAHVASVLRQSLESRGLAASFAMLACDSRLTRPAYVLYIDTSETDESLDRLAAAVDEGLRRDVHYDYARRLGQLAPLCVFRAEAASATYLNAAVSAGQRAGDVKPLALDRRDGWSQTFRGRFVAVPELSRRN